MSPQPPRVTVHEFRLDGRLAPAMEKGAASGRRRMAGWLTTFGHVGIDGGVIPTVDREGQVMEAARELGHIDWTHYLAKGAWNDTHDEAILVGRAEGVEFHDGSTPLSKAYGGRVGFWTRGELFSRSPESWGDLGKPSESALARADHFWGLATMLKGAGVPRSLGLSAHGEMAVSPCGKRILWARVRQAAVCELPMNPAAILEPMDKGAGALLALALRKGGGGRVSDSSPCQTCSCPEGGCQLRKAVTGGTLDPAVPEDLEGAAASQEDTPRERLIRLLMDKHHVSREDAERWIADYIDRRHGARSAA